MGVAGVLAITLVPPNRKGMALAVVTAGITVANVLGVPGGTFIGTWLGWRATFWIIGGIAILTATAMVILLPADKPGTAASRKISTQFRVLAQQKVYLTFSTITAMMVGFWALFAFVAPLLRDVSFVAEEWIGAYLIGFGVGATIGSFAAGVLADRWRSPTLLLTFPAQMLCFLLVMIFAHNAPAMAVVLFLLGFVMFVPGASLIGRILEGAADAPDLAATLVSTVFNIGIAAGAWAGAQALERGALYDQLPWFGIVFAALALVLVALSLGIGRRRKLMARVPA
jgi:DHA1 family inner membrane transport protein